MRFDEDEAFKAQSRQEVVNLQSGEPDTLKAWQTLCDLSRHAFQQIYDTLDVKLTERGESFYNPLLADVVKCVLSYIYLYLYLYLSIEYLCALGILWPNSMDRGGVRRCVGYSDGCRCCGSHPQCPWSPFYFTGLMGMW